MSNPDFTTALSKRFAPADVQKIVAFLEKRFSLKGELVIIGIFLYAKAQGKDVVDTLAACENEWGNNWKVQPSEIRADPDAPGGPGMQNRTSAHRIYQTLGIPNPAVEGRIIPDEKLVVETHSSTYRIGPVGLVCLGCNLKSLRGNLEIQRFLN